MTKERKIKSKDMKDPKTRMFMEFFESQGVQFVDVTSKKRKGEMNETKPTSQK